MTGLVENVRDRLDDRCLVKGGLRKEGCKVSLAGAPTPQLVIDFDQPGAPLSQDATRCDYLFVADSADGVGWIAPLELKKGQLHAGDTARQLQSGASAAEKLVHPNQPVRFRPVAATGSVSKAERKLLKAPRNRIRFHQQIEPVILMKCGTPLASVLCP